MSLRARVCVSVVSFVAAICPPVLAQPAAVDLGRFDDVAFRSVVQTPITIDAANPVRWFTITVPRISNPYRYLDIWTQNQTSFDTEIALYSSDGTLIANDDDDGADNHSALSFGITNVSAPQRVSPTAFAGQAAGVPNNGRDGVISGPSPLGPTVATYYIAVTEYDATFANNFSVTRTVAPLGLFTSLVVRVNTPGGEISPTITDATSIDMPLGPYSLIVTAYTSVAASSLSVDLSSVGGGSQVSMFDIGGNEWISDVVTVSTTTMGVVPISYRATNSVGDVGTFQATATVRQVSDICRHNDRGFATTAGTTVYTYDTTAGNVDGPWTANCYTQAPTGNDVWFSWTPSMSGTATFSTCNTDTGVSGAQPDTLLGVKHACFDSAFYICADDTPGCGFGTRLTGVTIFSGQTYKICVRAWSGDIVGGKLAVIFTPDCDRIDFNDDGLFPDTADIDDFLSVFSGGPCSTGTCGDIDFNNDGLFPDTADIDSLLSVFSGGACV